MCWYHFAMVLFDQPMNSITARSGTPSTSSTVAAVCRASCNRGFPPPGLFEQRLPLV